MTTSNPELSIVLPVYNEESCLPSLIEEIVHVMQKLATEYEIIAVDDGSDDGSARELERLREKYPTLKIITLTRNFGQTAALSAGFHQARGPLILAMDADGQNDPADIEKFLAGMNEDVDLISGWRKQRAEKTLSKIWPSKIANWIIGKTSTVPLHDFGCTMKLYRKSYLDNVHLYGEMHRFIPIFVHFEGGKIDEIIVNHRMRKGGRSKYGLERIFKVLMDLVVILFFVSLRDKPIYLFGGIGCLEFLLGSAFVLTSIFFKIFGLYDFVSTPLPNMGMFLVVLGMLTALMGLLADLTMRTYYESQGKKPYRIKNISG
jgi:dolichol-phosphate mannosyltransferase